MDSSGVGPQRDSVDAFLAHHGVKGMKWGVRKKRKPTAEERVRKIQEKSYVNAAKDAEKLRKLQAKRDKLSVKSDIRRIRNENRSSNNNNGGNGGGGNKEKAIKTGGDVLSSFMKNQGKLLVKNIAQETIQNNGKKIANSWIEPYSDVAVSALSRKKK